MSRSTPLRVASRWSSGITSLEEARAVVMGASPDPVAKVKRFHEKEALEGL